MVVKIGGVASKGGSLDALKQQAEAQKPAATPQKSQTQGSAKPMGFIKQGADAKALFEQKEAEAAAAKDAAGKLRRFFIKDGDPKDYTLTFLDGHLGEDGTLEAPMWEEHFLHIGGQWRNIPCTASQEPCPICANPDNRSALVAGFTVINHTPYVIQSGQNAGKTIVDRRQLFVCKRTVFATLQKLATKQGGLAGTTWEVSRNGEKSPSTGNLFQPVEKRSMAELKKLYGDEAMPANFEEEIVYYTADELLKMGVKGAVGGKVGGVANSPELNNELGFG